jgi:hypothetical protein
LHFISDCHKLDLENLGENSKQVGDHGVNISKFFFSHASGGVHCCHCGQKDRRCSVIWRKMCIVAGLFMDFPGLGLSICHWQALLGCIILVPAHHWTQITAKNLLQCNLELGLRYRFPNMFWSKVTKSFCLVQLRSQITVPMVKKTKRNVMNILLKHPKHEN